MRPTVERAILTTAAIVLLAVGLAGCIGPGSPVGDMNVDIGPVANTSVDHCLPEGAAFNAPCWHETSSKGGGMIHKVRGPVGPSVTIWDHYTNRTLPTVDWIHSNWLNVTFKPEKPGAVITIYPPGCDEASCATRHRAANGTAIHNIQDPEPGTWQFRYEAPPNTVEPIEFETHTYHRHTILWWPEDQPTGEEGNQTDDGDGSIL